MHGSRSSVASLKRCDNPGCQKTTDEFAFDWLAYDRPTGVGATGRWSNRTLFCSWACLLTEMERDYKDAQGYGWEPKEDGDGPHPEA